jgi:hypothetical protein
MGRRDPVRVALSAPILATSLVLFASGCGGGQKAAENHPSALPSWPAPSDPLARTVRAGLDPERKETLVHHVHAHLDVLVDGRAVLVPAGVGINIHDPGVQHSANPVGYGGIELCERPCISPLHTHDESGVIHTESATAKPNTLGQFFVEWGVKLDTSCVGEFCRPQTPIEVYVNGVKDDGDPRRILLTDMKEIAVVIGTPPAEVPSSYDFSNA